MKQNMSVTIYSLHPTIQDALGNMKNPYMYVLFWFFFRESVRATVIHRMHASEVKAHAESNRSRNKHWLLFFSRKTNDVSASFGLCSKQK